MLSYFSRFLSIKHKGGKKGVKDMKKIVLVFTIMLLGLGLYSTAHAGLIGLDIRLEVPQAGPPFDGTETVVDPGVEFMPFDQLSWDFFDNGDVVFHPLISALFITYDAIFTINTPGIEFTGVSGLSGGNITNYSVLFDVPTKAVIMHHEIGNDVFTNNLSFNVASNSVPEPSTFLLLSAGLAGVGLLRRRFKK